MASSQQRDKISGLVLVVAMVAIAAGLRAWPHRFPDSRQLRLSKASALMPAPVLAIEKAPVSSPSVFPVPTAVRRLKAGPDLQRPVVVTIQATASARPRSVSSSPEPLVSRPILLRAGVPGVPEMPSASAGTPGPARETTASNMGASLARAFSRAGHKTAHAFSRAF